MVCPVPQVSVILGRKLNIQERKKNSRTVICKWQLSEAPKSFEMLLAGLKEMD